MLTKAHYIYLKEGDDKNRLGRHNCDWYVKALSPPKNTFIAASYFTGLEVTIWNEHQNIQERAGHESSKAFKGCDTKVITKQ